MYTFEVHTSPRNGAFTQHDSSRTHFICVLELGIYPGLLAHVRISHLEDKQNTMISFQI